jgi:hypothetical protein
LYSCRLTPGTAFWTLTADVEPLTEHSFLSLRLSGPCDRRVVRAHEQVLAGDEVRPGEADLLLAGVRDRVGPDDVLDLPRCDERLTLRRDRLDELRRDAELLGDEVGDVDVETGVGRPGLLAEARLVELDADLDRVTGA